MTPHMTEGTRWERLFELLPSFLVSCSFVHALPALNLKKKREGSQSNLTSLAWNFCPEGVDVSPGETSQAARSEETQLFSRLRIGGFHVTSLPPCWWTVNKRSLISSLCLSTSICSFHHCYLCLPRLHENHLYA